MSPEVSSENAKAALIGGDKDLPLRDDIRLAWPDSRRCGARAGGR